jgi:hypothetical protein
MMRLTASAAAAIALALLVSPSTAAQSDVLERAFTAGGRVVLDLSAGSYEVVGTTDTKIRVDWRKSESRRVNVDAHVKGKEATVSIDGPLTKGAVARIELPHRSDLVVRLSAGELYIRGVEGSKDVSAQAGEINIQVGARDQYRRVDASVSVGELNASAFDINKEGFFRSVTLAGKGKYDLRARLTAGELTLVR